MKGYINSYDSKRDIVEDIVQAVPAVGQIR
jgi:hypothetical protein